MPRRLALGLAFTTAILAGCGGAGEPVADPGPTGAIRVASFDFDESALLAELYAQVIEASGTSVDRMGPVGPREVVAPALELGRIDFVPEYLGTLLRYTGAPDTESETESAREELLDRLAPRGLTALGASPAEDKNVIVVTVETAERLQLRTISDLGDEAGALRFGGPPECVERPLCLAGLESVYGLRFGEFVAQPSLDFTSESLRRGEIDVGLLFSTAIQLDDSNLVELDDDRALQPAENIVPIVRTDALARWHADVPTAVNRMSSVLTTNDLRALNREVAEGMAVTDVARGWLSAQGLLAPG
ncbi:MAG: ABC transporter substrate-binding protein [Acidimicrobiia bacterium]|nr:ABC transporter substrate-binding protein [Acidimicrobiia bacterium]